MAKSGRHCVNSLPTTVTTPPKNCGRKRSSSPAVAGPSVSIRVAKPSGYMVLTSGFQIKSTFSAVSLATSAFQVRGYETKSSVGAHSRQPNQRHMAVMECSHGWHQRDGGFSHAKALEGATQRRYRADDHGAWRHQGSICEVR